MPKGFKEKTGPVVNKTVSLPLPIIARIAEIQEVMGSDFSTTLLRLLRLGISTYEDQVRTH